MNTHKRMTRVELKRLEHKLERTDVHSERDDLTVPGIIIAQVMRKASAATIAMALFSLAFSACATQTYDVRPCPAPLTASGCAQWLEGK